MTLSFVVPEVYDYSLNIVPPKTLFFERISLEDIPPPLPSPSTPLPYSIEVTSREKVLG